MLWWIGLIICVICFLNFLSVEEEDYFWSVIFGAFTFLIMVKIGWSAVVFVLASVVVQRIFKMDGCLRMVVGSVLILLGGLYFTGISLSDKEPEGKFLIENPMIQESRYEILSGNDAIRVNGDVSGYFFWGSGSVSGSISEDSFYQVYYLGTNGEGENIAIPKKLMENETEVVLCPDDMESEYLIEIVTTQQYMERKWYRYPEERYFDDVSCKYKLYVRESTFNNKVVLDGN